MEEKSNKKIIILIIIVLVLVLIVAITGYMLANNKKNDNNNNNQSSTTTTEPTTSTTTTTTTTKAADSDKNLVDMSNMYQKYGKCTYNKQTKECKYSDGLISKVYKLTTKGKEGQNYKITFIKNGKIIYEGLDYIKNVNDKNNFRYYLEYLVTKEVNGNYIFKTGGPGEGGDTFNLVFKIYDKSMNVKYDIESQEKSYKFYHSGVSSKIDFSNNKFIIYYVDTSNGDYLGGGDCDSSLVEEGYAKSNDIVMKIDEITVGTDVKVNTKSITAKEYDSVDTYCNILYNY